MIGKITIDKIEISNSKAIGNQLAHYFADIGKTYVNRIPKSDTCIDDYLTKIECNLTSLFLLPTSETEVKKLIDELSNKSSSGWDGMSNVLLKKISAPLVYPLTIAFNKSITEAVFPTIMKLACVTPLHKSGYTDLCTNYRPISLLPVLSKLLEQIIYKQTYGFLVQNLLLYTSQYGFRKQHSCECAIQELLGTVLKGNERNKHTAAIFIKSF